MPEPVALSLTGLGALVVNLSCAVMLARVRHVRGHLTYHAIPEKDGDFHFYIEARDTDFAAQVAQSSVTSS